MVTLFTEKKVKFIAKRIIRNFWDGGQNKYWKTFDLHLKNMPQPQCNCKCQTKGNSPWGKKMEEMNGTLVVCKKKHMDDPLIQQGRPSSAMGHLVQLASGGGDHW